MSAICPTLQIWHVRKPNVSHFDIFGSKAFIHIPELIRGKQFPKGREVTFLGYSELSKVYRVFIPFLIKTTRKKPRMNQLIWAIESVDPSTNGF
jgi:hypothetical protein